MKKIFIGVMLVALMFVCAPTPASAVTIAELQAMIASLTAQLNVLIGLQNGSGGTIPIINPTGTSTGLIVFSEKPTLKLGYDKNKSESKLEGKGVVTVQAGANDVLLANVNLKITDVNGKYAPMMLSSFDLIGGATQEGANTSDGFQYKVWRISANSKASFSLSLTANPQIMFAGSYNVSLAEPSTVNAVTGYYQSGTLAYEDTKSLPVTIIGEKSPYISGSDFKGTNVMISGVRFAKGDKVYVNNVRKGVLTDVSKLNNGLINGAFPISWLDKSDKGGCALYGSIQIEDPKYGKSNNVYISRGCGDTTGKLSAVSMEFIGVDKGLNIFKAGQAIKFSVKGISSDGKQASPLKGFHVQSAIRQPSQTTTWDTVTVNGVVQSVNAEFNYSTGYWDVTMTAPSDPSVVYNVDTAFYCSMSSAGCVDGSQINQSFNFTIGNAINITPSITITSPNGGGYYAKNSPMKVTWTTNIPQTEYLDVIRLRAYPNGQEYYLAGGVLNTGGTNVTIPSNVPAGGYTLEIKTYTKGSGILVMDASDSYFKITDSSVTPPIISPTSPTVLYPNGGEILTLAKDSILVNFKPVIGINHSINLVDLSGGTYSLATGITGQPTTSQSIGISTSIIKNYGLGNGKYKIEICGQLGCDLSDNYFTLESPIAIQPLIKVLSPNGGENIIQEGHQYPITWSGNSISTVFVDLVPANSPGNGVGTLGIIGSVSSGNVIYWDAKTVWTDLHNGTPIIVPPGIYKVHLVGNVVNVTGQTVSDMSDNYFTINPLTVLPVVLPATTTSPSIIPATAPNTTTPTATKICYVGSLVSGGIRWEVKSCTSSDYLRAPANLKKEVVATTQAEQLKSIANVLQAIKEMLKGL